MTHQGIEHDHGGGTDWQDILRPALDVVFVGYNPSLVAWRSGHYYANPGNRFYHLLYESGLTARLLRPHEDQSLPDYGIGLTDLIAVPSASSAAYPAAHFRAGAAAVRAKLVAVTPRAVACNGLGVFRHLFGQNAVRIGCQPGLAIGSAAVFALPSSSGRCNGRAAERLDAYRELAAWLTSGARQPARIE